MSASDSWLIANVEQHLRCNIGSLEQLIIIKYYVKIIFHIFLIMFDNIIKNGLNENFL